MKLTNGNKVLNLPSWIKFGLELEVENVDYSTITQKVNKLGWHTDKDPSLTDSGVETVSPVLSEANPHVWETVTNICKNITESPNDTRGTYTDHTCGGHIHFDATPFRKNPEMMKNFMRLWAESEELVYKMCNDKNDPIREGAINSSGTTMKNVFQELTKPSEIKVNSLQSLCRRGREILKNASNAERKLNVLISDLIISKNGMAAPISTKIQKQLEAGKLKLGMPKNSIYDHTIGKVYRDIIVKNKLTPSRYLGLNLSNLGTKNKNTIEFRMSNGTTNPQTLKENVFLYASILNTAVEMTQNPKMYQERLQKFYQRNVSEETKANNFLELIMDSQEDRKIYMDRWESVKDSPVFTKNGAKNFANNTFIKDDFQLFAERTPTNKVQNAMNFIKNLKEKTVTKNMEESYGHER